MAGNDNLAVIYDRDMRVRLSHYPEVYAIYSFALGHTEYVGDEGERELDRGIFPRLDPRT